MKDEEEWVVKEIQSIRRTWLAIAGFEDGEREPWAKEHKWPLQAENNLHLTAIKEIGTPVLKLHGTEFCQLNEPGSGFILKASRIKHSSAETLNLAC